MKIAACIVTFKPDNELLYNNIKAFADHVDVIIVWRNSNEELCCLNQWKDKIIIMGDGDNRLIAYPLNQALKYCYANDFDFLLTMDQDSCWCDFENFIKNALQHRIEKNIAIYAPNVNGYLKNISLPFKDIEWVIQSGMLIDLGAIKDLGGFREDYGIYGVDEEFCYWLNLNNKKVRCYTNFHLTQKYGNATKSKLGFVVYNYSPFVRFHLIRNMIWMKREFIKSTTMRRIISVILKNYRDILLIEDNKLTKLNMFTKGIIHGIFKSIPAKRKCLF